MVMRKKVEENQEVTQKNNLKIYDLVRTVPDNAKKNILAGRLKGKTDINPQWRIKKLTEIYGSVGIGWYVKTVNEEIVNVSCNGEILYFVNIELYVKNNNEWSMAIEGSGGSKIVTKESKGMYVDDDAKKKAKTDALGKACQLLGLGADVYWENDISSKYDEIKEEKEDKTVEPTQTQEEKILSAKIKNIIFLASAKNEKEANKILGNSTEFINKEGKPVGRTENWKDIDKFKLKRLQCVYGYLSKNYTDISEKVKQEFEDREEREKHNKKMYK